MSEFKQIQAQRQVQKQTQRQRQVLSQRQIQAVNMISMSTKELKAEIYKAAEENPAIEIVSDDNFNANYDSGDFSYSSGKRGLVADSDAYQKALEAQEDRGETLQQHLLNQLNMINLSDDEYELSERLIYNLDKNGCYGSLLAPETLLDKKRPLQNKVMLNRCIERIQQMDPVGTCCFNLEESLLVQAKVNKDASKLTLFILDGHLELLNPPFPDKVLKNLKKYAADWHSKKFAGAIVLDELELSEEMVEETINYILHLNPHPAADYISDTREIDFEKPDVILNITKVQGNISEDDFSKGKIRGGKDYYYQVKYASGDLPEVRIVEDQTLDKNTINKAKEFLSNLAFRESTIILQGCAIVREQMDFFDKGPGHLNALTRRKVAEQIGVHESTVSRMSGKKNSKYIQTEWGVFPASYFFCSGIEQSSKIILSSDEIKTEIGKILEEYKGQKLSDSKLSALLEEKGIKVARRTVAKYREQLGIRNSYNR